MYARLIRQETGPQGTFGIIQYEGGSFFTAELPDYDNTPNVSCIPADTYTVVWNYSPMFKRRMYMLMDVPGRSGIRIHSGNWAGSKNLGFRTNVLGCIMFGKAKGELMAQKAILISRPAVRAFENFMNHDGFELEIVNGIRGISS